MPIDYKKWDHIEVSDDEDDTHPNIDTPSLFRWRHQARLDRMKEKEKSKIEISEGKKTAHEKMEDIRKKLAETSLEESVRAQLSADLRELERQEEEYRKKEEELAAKERLEPWNIDTIGHEGINKSRINKVDKPKQAPMSDDERSEQMKKFYDKYEKEIKRFSFLRKWDDSKQFLLENPELSSEFTADYLTITCLNYAIEEKYESMEHCAHQVIVIQYLVELAKQLDYSPKAPQLISSFFTKIQKADPSYMNMFKEELDGFKQRIRDRANVKRAEAVKELEEEQERERQERIKASPGGLDPAEVFETLPEEMQKCFETQQVDLLKHVAETMDRQTFLYHLDRCVKSGLWVPEGGKLPGQDEVAESGGREESMEDENKNENEESDGTELRQRKK